MPITMRSLIPSKALSAALFAVGCGQEPAPAPQGGSDYQPVATVRDIMTGMLDPSSAAIWQSVAMTITAAGADVKAPKSDEDWAALRTHALQLIEASNLLQIPGRAMARAGEASSFPGIELGPQEIQALVDTDRAGWMTRARELHTAVMPTLQAIEAKDTQKLEDAGELIDAACENCHLQYWYPNAPEPPDIVPGTPTIGS
jgi:hypothetical protein